MVLDMSYNLGQWHLKTRPTTAGTHINVSEQDVSVHFFHQDKLQYSGFLASITTL